MGRHRLHPEDHHHPPHGHPGHGGRQERHHRQGRRQDEKLPPQPASGGALREVSEGPEETPSGEPSDLRRELLPGLPGLRLRQRSGRAGEARLSDPGLPCLPGKPWSAPHSLPRSAPLLRVPSLRQRRGLEGHPGLAGAQRHRHHQQHLHPPQLQLQGELRPGHPGHSPRRKLRLVRLPMRKMTSGTSENPPAQAGQGFRDFGFPGDNQAEVRLAPADATEMASDFHRKTAKPQRNQGLGGGRVVQKRCRRLICYLYAKNKMG